MGHVDHQGSSQFFDLLQAFGHPVKGAGQLADLIVGNGRHPDGKVACGYFPADCGHPGQGGKHPAHHSETEHHSQDHRRQTRPEQITMHGTDKHGMGGFR